jgi:diguanylate cyclase (GGDEF)-like protein/PAS domain S-box-containing protein
MNLMQSLTARLFRLVFGWYLALAILVTAVQLGLEYSSISQTIHRDLEALGRSFQPGVADALWSFDRSQLVVMANGMVQTGFVTGAKIEAANGEVLALAGVVPVPDDGAGEGLLAAYQRQLLPLTLKTPRGEQRMIGQLLLYSDRRVALERVEYSFFVILVNSLVKTAGLWLIFTLVITRVLAKPLRRLTEVVSRLEFAAESSEPVNLDYPRDDELGRLASAMDRMQERLQASRRQLEGVNRHLEDMVAERTQELQYSEQRLSLALRAANQAWWDWNLESGKAVLSESYYTMLGYEVGEFAPTYDEWCRRMHPDDLALVEALQRRVLVEEGADHVDMEYRMRAKDGTWRWIGSQAVVVDRDEQGRPRRIIGTNQDVTRQRQAEDRLRLAANVFAHAHEGICVTDAQERIVDVNPRFCELTGYPADEVLGRTPRMLKSGYQSAEFYKAMWQAISRDGHWRGEVWNRRRDGRLYAERLTISAVTDSHGVVSHYVGVLSDITSAKEYEERLERIAHYDVLTGIPNRSLLADRMSLAIAQTQRSRTLLGVCYLDLDGFKPVNDTYGHEVGDLLLVEVAERLRACLRGGDTVARLGGDEFVLLLLGLDSIQECRLALERILEALRRPMEVSGHRVEVSASIGVSLYPQDNADADTLLRHADMAMYQAKQLGKNRYHLAGT